MNKREKMMLLVVGGMAVLMVGKWSVGKYRDVLDARETNIRALEDKLARTQLEKLDAEIARKHWLEIGEETLSMDVNEATRRLRSELTELIKGVGMENESVNMGQPSSWMKNGVRVLSATVAAEGDMGEIVQFLFRLYRQPYAVRVRSLTMNQIGGRTQRGQLKMTAKLETPLLPPNQMVPAIKPAVLEKDQRKEVTNRMLLASAADYGTIVEKKIFEPYVPPIPVPGKPASPNPGNNSNAQPNVSLVWGASPHAKSYKVYFGQNNPGDLVATQPNTTFKPSNLVPGTKYYWKIEAVNESGTTTGDVWSFTVVEQQVAGPSPPPPPPPPPPCTDCNMVLSRVLSSPRGQQAVLADPAQQNNPAAQDRRVEVGEQMFQGTLILVHPRGAVTDKSGARFFHAIGSPGSAKQPLTEKDQPEVYMDLMKLEERAKGISQVPG